MSPPKHWSPGKDGNGWRPNMCDIMLFDEEGDRHVIISWELALQATMCKNNYDSKTATIGSSDAGDVTLTGVTPVGKTSVFAWSVLAELWSLWNTSTNPEADKDKFSGRLNDLKTSRLADYGGVTVPGAEELKTKAAQYQTLMLFPMPMIVICRPFLEHLMHSCILTVAGRDTGATRTPPRPRLGIDRRVFFAVAADAVCPACVCVRVCARSVRTRGHAAVGAPPAASQHSALGQTLRRAAFPPFRFQANTQVKTIDGHYTGHFKAVITKPQNVMVLRDVACAGYVAGGNCIFFGDRFDKKDFDPSNVKEDIEKRLAFSEDVGAKYGSMLAFPMWEDQLHNASSSLDTVMSVSGRLLPWEVTGTNSAGMHNSFPGGETAFAFYSALLGLRAIHFGEDLRAAENQDFISQV